MPLNKYLLFFFLRIVKQHLLWIWNCENEKSKNNNLCTSLGPGELHFGILTLCNKNEHSWGGQLEFQIHGFGMLCNQKLDGFLRTFSFTLIVLHKFIEKYMKYMKDQVKKWKKDSSVHNIVSHPTPTSIASFFPLKLYRFPTITHN